MVIYVVKRKDNIQNIATTFETSAEEIIKVNELQTPDELVVGQALILPIDTYVVREGEKLYQVSNKLNVPFRQLVDANNLNINEPLEAGLKLTIPSVKKQAIFTNAYVDPFINIVSEELEKEVEEKSASLTYLAPFSYTVERDGTLNPPAITNLPDIAKDNKVSLMLVITNIEDGAFSEELGRIIVTNKEIQDKILDQAIEIAEEVGFTDVHFDLEFLPVETKDDYNAFLLKAKERLSENNLLLSTALAPKTFSGQVGQWYGAHDYKAHGEIADFVVLMTYEWGYTFGLPMAVSPIGPVKDVVEYALSEMPAEKIFLGQNLYGYDWREPYEIGGEAAISVSPNQAVQLARLYNKSIKYDNQSQAPYFKYKDQINKEHTVWFEDARSISAKFDLIRKYNLKGISYWRLGYNFPQNWYMLNNQFNINKLLID